jgi:quercetin dioxygenase-like cupin family protein
LATRSSSDFQEALQDSDKEKTDMRRTEHFMENLQKLQELTETLPLIPTLSELMAESFSESNYLEIETKYGGPIMVIGCYKNDDIAIVRSFAIKGTAMEMHQHAEKEIFVVYSGCMEVYYQDGHCARLLPGDLHYIPPETPHYVMWPENTWEITILMPSIKELPNGRSERPRSEEKSDC